MKIEITYKNGNKLTEAVNYAHIENDAIYYTVRKQVHPIYQEPVRIPLENVDTVNITEEEA